MPTRYRVPPGVTGEGCGSIPIIADNTINAVDRIRNDFIHKGLWIIAARVTLFNLQINQGQGWHNAVTLNGEYRDVH